MFCHEKLKVYQLSIKFAGTVLLILRSLPPGNADVAGQLRRAALSIPLNIAEGAGRTGLNDKRRFYAIARGSALECAAILDLIRVWQLSSPEFLTPSVNLLEEIAAMLAALVLKS